MKTGPYRLNQVPIGEKVRVRHISGNGAFRQRILDMGLTKNAEIQVLKIAPLGDPIEITVRGSLLSLRKAEAAQIEVI